ncbi:MAG: sigma-70 family RNA polymerase sigma factor [Acidiferrobacteraceae bacterium]
MVSDRRRRRFQDLTLPYLDRLLAAARRRGAAELAEDLVQDTYLRAWQAFDQLHEAVHAYSWLYRIMLNLLAEDRRRAQRRQILLPITDLEKSYEALVASPDPGPCEILQSRLERASVQTALARLPDEFAEALTLHDIEGFKYRDISAITGVPIGTVMSRISRGRRLLAALLTCDTAAVATRAARHVTGHQRS